MRLVFAADGAVDRTSSISRSAVKLYVTVPAIGLVPSPAAPVNQAAKPGGLSDWHPGGRRPSSRPSSCRAPACPSPAANRRLSASAHALREAPARSRAAAGDMPGWTCWPLRRTSAVERRCEWSRVAWFRGSPRARRRDRRPRRPRASQVRFGSGYARFEVDRAEADRPRGVAEAPAPSPIGEAGAATCSSARSAFNEPRARCCALHARQRGAAQDYQRCRAEHRRRVERASYGLAPLPCGPPRRSVPRKPSAGSAHRLFQILRLHGQRHIGGFSPSVEMQ